MRKRRHNYSPEEKVIILKQHLLDQELVSNLCEKYQLQPKIFYGWQKQFFEKGAVVFIPEKKSASKGENQQIQLLEEKLCRKHKVVPELSEKYILLKKALGEP